MMAADRNSQNSVESYQDLVAFCNEHMVYNGLVKKKNNDNDKW